MGIEIQKGVPMPSGRVSDAVQAMRTMEIGDSIVVPQRPVGASVSSLKPRRFVTRKVDNGFRVWRCA